METLASGSIDLKSLKVAGTEPYKYITTIDSNDGIQVHAVNNSELNYVQINSNGMEIFQTDGGDPAQAISVAKFGNEVRVGTEENSSITITDTSIKGVGVSGKEFFEFTNSATSLTTTNTNKIFKKLLDFPSTEAKGLGLLFRETPTSAPVLRVIIVQNGQTTVVNTGTTFTVGTSSHNTLSLNSYGTLYIDYDGNKNFSKIYITPHYTTDYTTTIELRISYTVTSLAPAFQLGSKHSTTGGYSYAEGYYNSAIGNYSHAEGYHTTASGAYSHAEGYYATASDDYSHAEGYYTTASGENSHAEGGSTTAEGDDAHAEGYHTTAHAYCSHAEGWNTVASGNHSHAEGFSARASGHYSHAQNNNTIAASYNQTAIGKYNQEENENDYALIIGNGTADNARSNALVIDWNGNVMTQGMAGQIIMFAGSTAPTGWLICDGSAISRTTYATLYAIIGTTYGAGDGSTTFNLPDMQNRFPIGVSATYGLNAKGGSKDAVVVTHTHSITSSGAHTHNFKTQDDYATSGTKKGIYSTSDGTWTGTSVMESSGAHTHTAPAPSNAVAGTDKNLPPYIGVNFIIATGKTFNESEE